MPKGQYVLAIVCYVAIPVVVIAGAAAHIVIDPEIARGRADYVRTYQVLDLVRLGVLIAAAGLAGLLWIACCYLVLESRRRSRRWLALAVAGPFGFSLIAMLKDLAPSPADRYQRFIGGLKTYWRVAFELAMLVAIWTLTYEAVVLKRGLMIGLESFMTGTPASSIISQQTASSGMWAAGEAMEQLYLVVLVYLLWPIAFNVAGYILVPKRSVSPVRHAPGAR
jgi:hypothetical protein